MQRVAKGVEIALYGAIASTVAILPLYGFTAIVFRYSMSSQQTIVTQSRTPATSRLDITTV